MEKRTAEEVREFLADLADRLREGAALLRGPHVSRRDREANPKLRSYPWDEVLAEDLEETAERLDRLPSAEE